MEYFSLSQFIYQGNDYIYFIQFLRFFIHIFFLYIIDCFSVFSYSKVNTLIQSLSLVNLIFNFEINSFVINIATDVNIAVELDIIIPALGFNIANVLELIVEADPNKISVIINKTFFLFKDLYFFIIIYYHSFS